MTSAEIDNLRTLARWARPADQFCFDADCDCSCCPGEPRRSGDKYSALTDLEEALDRLWLDAIHREARETASAPTALPNAAE